MENQLIESKRILIIEDDSEISNLLDIHLSDQGFKISKSFSGKKGLELARTGDFDLVILDIMLPEKDGLEICKEIRKMDRYIPVLILTSKSAEIDKVLGLELGADDYQTKPFSIREFIARIKAVIRREEGLKKSDNIGESLQHGDLIIEASDHRVLLNGERIELTPKEFSLLYLMARHPGRTYTRADLLEQVWGYQFSGYEHTVNSHINRLRSKIEKDLASPQFILTSWGLGYRFNDQYKN